MIEADLVKFLADGLSVTVYFVEAPHDVSVPFIVFDLSGREEDNYRGGKGLTYSDFMVDCYHNAPDKAAMLAGSLKELIQNYSGAMGDSEITLARISNEFDSKEPDSGSFMRSFTLNINNK